MRIEAEAVADPLHDGAADEDAAFEARTPVRPPICHATVVTSCCVDRVGAVPMFCRQEAAGAVGVLRHAWLAAHLAEERRLLIAGDAGNRHASMPSDVETVP